MTEYWQTQMEHKQTATYYAMLKTNLPEKIFFMLEIGNGWGISTHAILEHPELEHLISIDKLEEAAPRMEAEDSGQPEKVEFIVAESKEILPRFNEEKRRFDCIYIDGSHICEDVYTDLNETWPLLLEGGKMILDDFLHDKNSMDAHDRDAFGITKAVKMFMQEHPEITNYGLDCRGHGMFWLTKGKP